MTYAARYRIEVDWSDSTDNPYSHTSSDVTYLINSYKSTHGNTVYLEDREGRLDVGEGKMQLRYEGTVFGTHGSVSVEELESIHKIRLTDVTTQTECWEGLVELDNEFDAHFTNGDVLSFNLHGKGYLKDGGSWTYPRGSAFGGSVNDGLQVVVSEDAIDPTAFASAGTIDNAIPTRMVPTTDGKLVGQDGSGNVIELDGTTRRSYSPIAQDGTDSVSGRNGNLQINVTRTYRNYEESRIEEDAFGTETALSGTLPTKMQTMGDGRAIGRLSTGAVVELEGGTRRQYAAIGVDSPASTVAGSAGNTDITVNKRVRNYTQSPIDTDDFSGSSSISGSLPTKMQTMGDGRAIGRLSNGALVELDGTTRRQYPAIGVNSSRSESGQSSTVDITVNKRTRNYELASRFVGVLYDSQNTEGDCYFYVHKTNARKSNEDVSVNTGGIGNTLNLFYYDDHFYYPSGSKLAAYRVSNGSANTSADIPVDLGSVSDQGTVVTSDRVYVLVRTYLGGGTVFADNRTSWKVNVYNHSGTIQTDENFTLSSSTYGRFKILKVTSDRIYFNFSNIRIGAAGIATNQQLFAYNKSGTLQTSETIVLSGSSDVAQAIVIENNDFYVYQSTGSSTIVTINKYSSGGVQDTTFGSISITSPVTSRRWRAFMIIENDNNNIISTKNEDEANYSVSSTNGRESENTTYSGPVFSDNSSIYRVRRVRGREYDSYSTGSTTPSTSTDSSDWTDTTTFNSLIHHVDITYSWSSGEIETRTWDNWNYFGHSYSRNVDGSLNISSTGLAGGTAPTLVRSGTLTYLQAANGLYVIKNGTLYELGNVASGTGTATSRGALPANSNASVAGGKIGTKDYLLTDDSSGIREITDASTATLGTAESFPDAVRPTAWSVSGGTAYMYRLADGDYWTADFGRSLLHTNTTTESNYSVPATVDNVTTTVTFSGPLFDFSSSLWRARRTQERNFDTYSGGTNGPTESTSSSDWDQTNTGVAYNSSLHYIDITYTWSTGNKTTQNTDVWDAAGYSYSRNADNSLAINSSVFSGGTIPTIMRSGTRTYFTSGSGLYLIASGNLYLITGMNTNTVTATSQGALPTAVNDARAAAEVGQYRYLISDNGAAWYNNDDLDNSPVLIGNFASGIRPHAIGYDSGNIHIYDLTGSKYWVASRGRTLLGSQTATVARNVPATIGNQTIRTNFAGSLFEYQNKLWKARRIRTRTYDSWIAGNTTEENGGSWFQVVTEDPSIHSKTTQFSWTAGNNTTSNTDVWDYAGYIATRSSSGSLSIGSSASTGGDVPTVLRGGTPLYFPAAGGLYVVRSGTLYQITGFPGAANLATLGTLANAYNNPRGALHVGDRTYLVSDNGRDIYQLDNLEGISTSDLGSFPSTLALSFLSYTAEIIYAYEQSGTRRVYQVDRFTRTARQPDSGDPEDEIQPLVDTLDVEYFDESKYGEPAFEYVKALAKELGVTFNESKSTVVPDTVSGLVRYGPQWDIALADTAYTGWTGQYMFALKDGSIAVAFPGDVRKGSRSLTFDNYFIVGPLEVKRNRTMVTNASRAQGIEQL